MSQNQVTRLVSKLRYNVRRRRKLNSPEGPPGRHDKIRKIVTALIKHERIEVFYARGDEARGYAERLISDAIRYGDKHQTTMEIASYWLIEKQLVHKLFKVLVPRYENWTLSYTKMWKAPSHKSASPMCVLELRNNIYPPLGPDKSNHKNLIHNVLLSAAKKAYEEEKAIMHKEKLMSNEMEKTSTEMPQVASTSKHIDSESVKMSSNESQKTEVSMEKEEGGSGNDAGSVSDDLSLNKLTIDDKQEEKESPPTEKDNK